MTHQIDVLSAKKCSCLSRCGELALSWWRVIRLRLLGKQLANKRLCTTQNWLFCVVLVLRLRHVKFFLKKTGDHLLESASCAGNFCLDLAHLETPIQSTADYFRAHRRKSTISCHDAFKSISFDQSTWAFFWAIDKLCGMQREQICLIVKCSCSIECMLVH